MFGLGKDNKKKEDTQVGVNKGRVQSGVVVSAKMDKTVVVRVDRYQKHPKYGKFMKLSKRYHAHDEANKYKEGDRVDIIETAPISKKKFHKVLER